MMIYNRLLHELPIVAETSKNDPAIMPSRIHD